MTPTKEQFNYNQYFPTEEQFSRVEIERIIVLHDMTVSEELIRFAKACFAESNIKSESV
jgi:hypothetical protein